jgi:nicotinamidase/pyrazinamidase
MSAPSPPRIFVDVDVQRDFCDERGALFVAGSPNDAFRALTRYAVARGLPILGSVDSHAFDAWEFASSETTGPNGERPNFPDHCVKGTAGWLKVEGTLPPRFRFVPNQPGAPVAALARELASGKTHALYFEKEVYSLFVNPNAEPLVALLARELDPDPELVVYGVATDYCVKAAALGLCDRGYRTTLVTDAVAGITSEGTRAALDELGARGVRLATVGEIVG